MVVIMIIYMSIISRFISATIYIDNKISIYIYTTNCYLYRNNNCAWSVIIFRYSYCNRTISMWSYNYTITWLYNIRSIIRCCCFSILVLNIRSYSLSISIINISVRINNTRSLRSWRSSFILNYYFYYNCISRLIRISYNYSCLYYSWCACVNWAIKIKSCSIWKLIFV